MAYHDIILEKKEGIARLTLNRPEALNAFREPMRVEIGAAIREVRDDPESKVLIFTGAGRAFAAGGDVKAMAERAVTGENVLARRHYMRSVVGGVLWELYNLEKPTIAMVNGVAAGGGCNLALACDLIIASDQARFIQSFVRVGLPPDWAGMYFLPRLVGMAKAKELIFTARPVEAAEAERIGLVNMVVSHAELEAKTMALAQQLAQSATAAIGLAKTIMHRSAELNFHAFLEYEALATTIGTQTEDHKEGARAFVEKRAPQFKGH
jgi:2-(1,2-epoxy-1,2-dihydrophenyl)acetyl-CoA isomerase